MPLSMRRLNRASSIAEMRRPTPKISTPVIQSSTNLHINEMMDLQTAQRMMAGRVSIDTNTSSSPPSSGHEPDLTDGSSAGSSPTLEPNHLTAYFPSPTKANLTSPISPAPPIPQRVPSHNKREHERLARKRSLRANSSMSGNLATSSIIEPAIVTQPFTAPTLSPPSTIDERTSTAMIGNEAAQPLPKLVTPASTLSPRSPPGRTPLGPFTPELQRLTEALQEQFMAVPSLEEDDTSYMRRLGLAKFDVSVYCADIGLGNPYPDTPIQTGFHPAETVAWI
ncbi:MAG: hypothetical protein Q9159_000089 [Coniocarpon cinnabarinum]